MYVTITPISSMWPASMIVGVPSVFTSAMLLPATSPRTLENFAASSRQTFAGADSNPEGPGVSSSLCRKPSESSLNIISPELRENVRALYELRPEYSTRSCDPVTYANETSIPCNRRAHSAHKRRSRVGSDLRRPIRCDIRLSDCIQANDKCCDVFQYSRRR